MCATITVCPWPEAPGRETTALILPLAQPLPARTEVPQAALASVALPEPASGLPEPVSLALSGVITLATPVPVSIALTLPEHPARVLAGPVAEAMPVPLSVAYQAAADGTPPEEVAVALRPELVSPRRSQTPGLGLRAGAVGGARLAQPLSAADAARYRRIFDLQERGDLAAADQLIGELKDRSLLGHVLWQRYLHPTAYRSTYAELADWLEHYADHPGADRIYSLAQRRRPAGAKAPAAPVRGYLSGAGQDGLERARIEYRTSRERSASAAAAVQAWQRQIEELVGDGRAGEAEALLRQPAIQALLDPVEVDLAAWIVARGHLGAGQHAKALALAGRAADRSGAVAPELHWSAGISAWHLGKTELARRHFATLAETAAATPAERSRAAFWAARAAIVTFRPQLVGAYPAACRAVERLLRPAGAADAGRRVRPGAARPRRRDAARRGAAALPGRQARRRRSARSASSSAPSRRSASSPGAPRPSS